METYDIEELCNDTVDTYELVRSIVYGEVTNVCDPVRYDGYANLYTVTESQLETDASNYASDYVDEMVELYSANKIDIEDDELREMVDEYLSEE